VSKSGTGSIAVEEDNDQLSLEHGKHLLRTKFFVPPIRSSQIARPRLSELIDRGLDCAIILVSAPAGYGKTTLVSNWLKEKNIPSAWLSLDAGDNDPIRFLQYMIAALATLAPNLEAEAFGMLQGVQITQLENIINLLVNELDSFPEPFVLVLDDFHVIHSEPILKILAHFTDHLPPHMHLALLTRTDPLLPLSRLRVRNQLLDIRADQLRFTREEVAVFLNDSMGLILSEDDLTAMEMRTEGWIAGLQLAALSMQGSRDIHAFVSAFTGSHHYVMDYLVEEVLKNQSNQVGSFLLQTSILDRLCGSLCEAVVEPDAAGPINGQSILEALEKMNLFLIPLDDERRWYRYHHLFADVLRKRLEHQHPQLQPELHRRASKWYEQNEFIAESIQDAISAGDQDRAAHLLEDNGCFLLMSGEVATLLNWADAIDFQSEARPWLAIQKAWALALTGDLERVGPTLQVPDALLAPLEPTDEVRTMQGTIASARAQCANSRGDMHSAAEYARQALQLLPDCSSISRSVRSVATSILGDASWFNGDMEEAKRAYTEAIRIGRDAGNLHMVIIANSNIADILKIQGQLHRAADIYTQCLHMAVRPDGQRSPLAANMLASMANIYYEWNRLDDADQYIHQCIDLCRQWGDIGLQAYAHAIRARIEQARGHPEQAGKAIRAAERLMGEIPVSSHLTTQLKSILAREWLAQGNLDKPSQHIQERGIQVKDDISYQRELDYDLLLRLLLARGDHGAAIHLSNRFLQQAEKIGQADLIIEALILRALALQGNKENEQALEVLEKALTLARPEGYVRSFLDKGEAMTRLLCLAHSRQVGGGYAAILLSGIEKTSGMAPPSMQLLVEPLTARELEVLKLINTGSSNQDIAGQLFISIPTVKRHISNIYAKLGVKSRTQAVAIGKELKFFD
jgi:LuxR family transcriptional regulator, maltose regulon positive regulatory protein